MTATIAPNPHELIHLNFLLHNEERKFLSPPLNLGQLYAFFFFLTNWMQQVWKCWLLSCIFREQQILPLSLRTFLLGTQLTYCEEPPVAMSRGSHGGEAKFLAETIDELLAGSQYYFPGIEVKPFWMFYSQPPSGLTRTPSWHYMGQNFPTKQRLNS